MSAAAVRCVTRELKQLATDPVPGVFVNPVEDNCMHWAVNLLFNRENSAIPGVVAHLHLLFSDDYPNKPPAVRLLNNFPTHSHVYDDKICFSLLSEFAQFFQRTGTSESLMFTPATTMSELLRQLHGVFCCCRCYCRCYWRCLTCTLAAANSVPGARH